MIFYTILLSVYLWMLAMVAYAHSCTPKLFFIQIAPHTNKIKRVLLAWWFVLLCVSFKDSIYTVLLMWTAVLYNRIGKQYMIETLYIAIILAFFTITFQIKKDVCKYMDVMLSTGQIVRIPLSYTSLVDRMKRITNKIQQA